MFKAVQNSLTYKYCVFAGLFCSLYFIPNLITIGMSIMFLFSFLPYVVLTALSYVVLTVVLFIDSLRKQNTAVFKESSLWKIVFEIAMIILYLINIGFIIFLSLCGLSSGSLLYLAPIMLTIINFALLILCVIRYFKNKQTCKE